MSHDSAGMGADRTTAAEGHTCWINGTQFDDRIEALTVGELRRLGEIPDNHDLFVESAAWDEHRLNLLHVEGALDVKLELDDKPVHLSVHRRFYSTPRYINAG